MSDNQASVTVNENEGCHINLVDEITDRIMAVKKIKLNREDVRKIVAEYFSYLKYFNSLPELTATIWDGVVLSDVPILKEFSSFVLPDSVRYDASDRRTTDLLVRSEGKADGLSLSRLKDLNDIIRGFTKRDASSETILLSELKKAVNLDSIITRVVTVDGRVRYLSEKFVPIKLQGGICQLLFEDRYFNADATDMLKDFVRDLNF